MRRSSLRPRPARSLFTHFALFAFGLTAPILILVGVVTWHYATTETAYLETSVRERAEIVLSAIERDVANKIGMLQALATSPALDVLAHDGTPSPRFEDQARELATLHGVNIVLRSLDGRQLVNTRLPRGAVPNGTGNLSGDADAIARQGPSISNLFLGHMTGIPLMSIALPVTRDGRAVAAVSVNASPTIFIEHLKRVAPEGGPYFATLADRDGRILTRSTMEKDLIGTLLPGFAQTLGDKGAWSGTNPEGVQVSGFYLRSPSTGWLVATGVDIGVLQAPLTKSLANLAALSLLMLGSSAAVASFAARRMTRSFAMLTQAAARVGANLPLEPPATPITEANRIGLALFETSVRLRLQAAALVEANQTLEARVDERTRALKASEDRAQRLLDALPQKVWITTLAGDKTYSNQAMFDYHSPMGPNPSARLLVHHPEDHDRVRAAREHAMRFGISLEIDSRIRRRDGLYRWHRLTLKPIIVNGAITEWIGTSLDIDDLRRVQGELEQAKVAADLASEAKSRFLATMSHEIRTPIGAVIGFSDLLSARTDLSGDAARQVGLIRTAGEALLTVIDDVLALARIEAGKLVIEPAPFDLRAMLNECLAISMGAAGDHGLEVSLSVDGAIPATVLGDEARIRQALLNLLANAFKFTARGFIRLEATACEGGRVALRVADSGIGIAADRQKRIFDDFAQAEEGIARVYGGSGLGLSITRRLVQLMAGEISVESTAGEGSVFQIVIPLPASAPQQRHAASDPLVRGPGARVLVVDDMEINRELVGAVLAQAGHEVRFATSAREAISAAIADRFDLIFMDIHMPDMSGVDATRHIRALSDDRSSVPIVALTASVLEEEISLYRAAGMTGHVRKPFRADDLLSVVNAALAQARKAPVPASDPLSAVAPDRVAMLRARFAADLGRRFASDDPSVLCSDAHAVRSAAGLLGFADLSTAAAALERASRAGEPIAPALDQVRLACTAVLSTIAAASRPHASAA